jgi:hypothetical protein
LEHRFGLVTSGPIYADCLVGSILNWLVAAGRRQAFAEMIDEEYRNHMLLDNLPIAMSVFHESGAALHFSYC